MTGENFQLQNSAQAIEFARETIKAAIALNGGAAIAILGFVGGRPNIENQEMVPSSLKWFCLGLAFSFATLIIAYLAQTFFATANSTSSPRTYNIAKGTSLLGLFMVVCSAAAFFRGVYIASTALFGS